MSVDTEHTIGGLTAEDLRGFLAGSDTACWRVLGSHVVTVTDAVRGPVAGTRFAVWAPNAQTVEVRGDFDDWAGTPLTPVAGTGVWASFVEGAREGQQYRYRLLGPDGVWRDKVDPMARHATNPPLNTSVIHESSYRWQDTAWMASRPQRQGPGAPLAIYEAHLGSWRRGRTYTQLADDLVAYLTEQGFTHVEFMPITEYPLEASWGYQVTNYFAPTARLGSPDELRFLIDRLHQAGIGVLLDWVPAHFPKDEWALGRFDGTALYEHADPRQGEHKEWGTLIFNYGRYEVRSFLASNALYWLKEFHFDGIRFDAVAAMLYLDYNRPAGEWVPNAEGGNHNLAAIDFIRYVTDVLHDQAPGVAVIAEESTAFGGVTKPVADGGLGFDFKWNMGWMNDSLRYLKRDPFFRQYHHDDITFAMVYHYSENYILPISHDEVVHGKLPMIYKAPLDAAGQFASLRAFYGYMWTFPGKKLLFMGCEFGQRREWDEKVSLQWELLDVPEHRGVQALVRDLNAAYRAHPALWRLDDDREGFAWLDVADREHNTFSWLRRDDAGEQLACAVNFSPVAWTDYQLALPAAGLWTEVLNTDAVAYGGSGMVTAEPIVAEPEPYLEYPASAVVTLPPLSAVIWRYSGTAPRAMGRASE